MTTEYDDTNPLLHRSVQLRATDSHGATIVVDGTVLTICPTKIPRRDGVTFRERRPRPLPHRRPHRVRHRRTLARGPPLNHDLGHRVSRIRKMSALSSRASRRSYEWR